MAALVPAACGPGALPPVEPAPAAARPAIEAPVPIGVRAVPARVPGAPSSDVAFSPDGRWVAILDREGALAVVDVATGALALSQRATQGAAGDRTLAWDATGARLAWSAGVTGGPTVLEVGTGVIHTLPGAGHGGVIGPIALGERLAWIEHEHGSAALVVGDERAVRPVAGLEQPAACGVALTAAGDLVTCEGARVVVREAGGMMRGAALLPQPASRIAVAGASIATLDRAGTVHLLDPRDGRIRATIPPRARRADQIALSADGRRVALASRLDPAGTIAIHDAHTGEEIWEDGVGRGGVTQVVLTADGAHVVATSAAGGLVVRGVRPGAPSHEVAASPNARLALSPDERTIAIAEPGGLRVVDRATGEPRFALAGGGSEPHVGAAWVIDEPELAIVVADGLHLVAWAPGRAAVVAACRAGPEGVLGAPGDALRWIGPDEICDLRTGARIAPPASLRPSADAGAAIDVLRGLRVRDGASGEVRATLAQDGDDPAGCATSQCPMLVASSEGAARVAAFREGALSTWDGTSGARLARRAITAPRVLAMMPGAVLTLDEHGRARALDPRDLSELAGTTIRRVDPPVHAIDPEGRFWALADERSLVVLRADVRARPARVSVSGVVRGLEARPGQRLLLHMHGTVELRSALDGARLARFDAPGAVTIDSAGAHGASCESGALRVRSLQSDRTVSWSAPCQAPRALRFVARDRAIVIEDLDAIRVVRARDGAWVELRVGGTGSHGVRAEIVSSDGRVEGIGGELRFREGGLAGPLRAPASGEDLLGSLLRAL